MDKRLINIGLDWDGTVTSDRQTFMAVATLLRQAGHKVYVVTMRYPSECGEEFFRVRHLFDGIYATSRRAKKPFMESLQIPIHVWIDDNPNAVYLDASQIWKDISPEGSPVVAEHGTPANS